MIERSAGHARLHLAPEHGGRVAQLTVGGRALLVAGSGDDNPMLWGMFPMTPWAGRVRRGRFTFAGVAHELPLDLPPHAIHGTTYARPWDVEPDGSLAIELGPTWPFGGYARQHFHLTPDGLTATIEVHAADRSMPAQAGWHPWFVKPVEVRFEPTSHYVLDGEGIPTGELGPIPPGPWDDCFTDLLSPPQLTWSGGPTLTLTSSCSHWVVYSQPAHAVCVEPQTGPPDGFTIATQVVEPGAPLVASFTLHWG